MRLSFSGSNSTFARDLGMANPSGRAYVSGMKWIQWKPAPEALLQNAILAVLLLTASIAFGTDRIDFTIVGRVQFSVPGDWPAISSKSTPEKNRLCVPNPKRGGPRDS